MALALTEAPVVRVNLGCGSEVRAGFINVDKLPVSPQVVQANFPHLPFGADYANEVLLRNVLEHLGYHDGATLCREVFRVLKPGATASLEVPEIASSMAAFVDSPEGESSEIGGYTSERLVRTLREAGFTEVHIHHKFSRGVQCLAAVARKAS